MDLYNLIFSDKRRVRIKRHFFFWFAWYVYFSLLHAVKPEGPSDISYFRNPVFTFTESVFFILAQLPLVYALLYIILPKFILQKKYILALLGTIFLWFLSGSFHLFFIADVMPKVISWMLPGNYLLNTQRPESTYSIMAIMGNYKGAFTVSAFALLAKFAKYWYLKEQRNLQLQKENTEAQLQLLTAQVHPHFLFNTLNNIFSQTQTESPKGSKMIMGLSDMLRYILYEGQKPLVPLNQELTMTIEYINLEKIRYGNKLDVHVLTPDKMDDIYIAPLMLLPFVENCFKHGASNMLQNPWINLTVELKDTTLVMKLMNGKTSANGSEQKKHGIGINNVRQRLELLYRDKHELQIREDEEVFVVDLKLELKRIESKKERVELVNSQQPIAYAN